VQFLRKSPQLVNLFSKLAWDRLPTESRLLILDEEQVCTSIHACVCFASVVCACMNIRNLRSESSWLHIDAYVLCTFLPADRESIAALHCYHEQVLTDNYCPHFVLLSLFY
jgi:hypothetical protein